MTIEIDEILDWTVTGAAWQAGGLAIALERGPRKAVLRYRRVAALAVSRSARLAAPSWIGDALAGTELRERTEGERGFERWLVGDAALAAGLPVRDALSFVGGRFFRVFVGALAREIEDAT